jgi:hypothetical protein
MTCSHEGASATRLGMVGVTARDRDLYLICQATVPLQALEA